MLGRVVREARQRVKTLRERISQGVRRKKEYYEGGDSSYDQYRIDNAREDLELNLLTDLTKYFQLGDLNDLRHDRHLFFGNLDEIMRKAKKEFTLNPFKKDNFEDMNNNGLTSCEPLQKAFDMIEHFNKYELKQMELKDISEYDYMIRFSTNKLLNQYIRDVRNKCTNIDENDKRELSEFARKIPVYQDRMEIFYDHIQSCIDQFNNTRVRKENRFKENIFATSDMVRNIMAQQPNNILGYGETIKELETEKMSLKTLPRKLELYKSIIGPLVTITEDNNTNLTDLKKRVRVYADRLIELLDGVHAAIEKYNSTMVQ